MPDLNDLARPVTTDTEPNVLDTLRAHVVRAATWAGWGSTANKVAGLMSAVTTAVSGGRSLRLYRRNDANTADEEVVSLPGISVGGNAATASAAQSGSALATALDSKAALNSPTLTGTPTTPTASAGTATGQIASTAFVATAVANVVNTAPAALDTLNELATALGNDPNFASSTATALGNRVVRTSANRPGVTRLYRRDDDSDYSVQARWTGSRWMLEGYNGDTFHAGVEVAHAATAGSAGTAGSASSVPWTGVTGRPTALSAFTNDSGFITSAGSISGNAETATRAASAVSADNGGVTSVNGQTGSVTVAVNTTSVLNATAGASVGAVGTYIFGRQNSATSPINPGDTLAGSMIEAVNATGGGNGVALSGTWRCMGQSQNNSATHRTTLWLRIS
jgi:hypothetical protein